MSQDDLDAIQSLKARCKTAEDDLINVRIELDQLVTERDRVKKAICTAYLHWICKRDMALGETLLELLGDDEEDEEDCDE
jgi:hypothetical protein